MRHVVAYKYVVRPPRHDFCNTYGGSDNSVPFWHATSEVTMNWIVANKEWIFSGVGVFAVGLVITYFVKRARDANITQNQTSGTNSNNYQSAGDLNVNIGDDNNV